MSVFNTNFITNIAGLGDLGNIFYNATTGVVSIPVTDPVNKTYGINYRKNTIIRTSDITATIDGSPNNGTQVYTFGPSQPNRWVSTGFSSGGTGNSIFYSSDSITFSPLGATIFTNTANRSAVFYSGSIWLMGNAGTNTMAYSYDGITWTGLGTTIFSIMCGGFSYNGTIYVASGSGTNTLAYSYDGINWIGLGTSFLDGNGGLAGNVQWNGISFVAGGSGTRVLAWSPNGINWTTITSATLNISAIWGFVWNGNYWVAVGSGATNYIIYSTNPNGSTWAAGGTLSGRGLAQLIHISFNGSIYIANGNITSGSTPFVYTFDPRAPANWVSTTALAGSFGWNGTIFSGGGYYSYDGINWIAANTQLGQGVTRFNNKRSHSITFPRNLIVAGGKGTNAFAYSINGITWIAASQTVTTVTLGLGYNGIRYIAGTTGDLGNSFAFSNDGVTWTGLGAAVCTNSFGNKWNGKTWVAACQGGGNSLAFSQCGLCWQGVPNSNVLFSDHGRVVEWNGSIWVAGGVCTGTPGNTLAYTTDPYGITGWTGSGNNIFSTNCYGVVWNGTLFLAAGVNSGSTSIAYSYNGINWTPSSSANSIFSNECRSTAWNGTLWIAGGRGTTITSRIAYSSDGINWTVATSANALIGSVFYVIWARDKWIAGGQTTNTSIYSFDGINWIASQNSNSIISTWFHSIVWSAAKPNIYIQHPTIIGGGSSGSNTLIYSPDGIQMRGLGNNIFSSTCWGIGWNGIMWVAVGSGTINTIAYSYDGIQWIGLGTSIFSSLGFGICWNGKLWVAGGNGGSSLAYSYNGIQWTSVTNSTSILIGALGVAWNGLYFVATGSTPPGNSLASSPDGINWSGVAGSADRFVQACNVATNGPLWVAVGNSGGSAGNTIAYTYDITGLTGWTNVENSTTIFSVGSAGGGAQCIAWNGSIWIAGGNGTTNSLAYSLNGITWVGLGRTVFTSTSVCRAVCWNGVRWVAVSNAANRMAYSQDGLTWYAVPNSSTYAAAGTGCGSNPQMGPVVVDSTIVLNNNGYESTQKLEIVSDAYFQTGFQTATFKIESSNIY